MGTTPQVRQRSLAESSNPHSAKQNVPSPSPGLLVLRDSFQLSTALQERGVGEKKKYKKMFVGPAEFTASIRTKFLPVPGLSAIFQDGGWWYCFDNKAC